MGSRRTGSIMTKLLSCSALFLTTFQITEFHKFLFWRLNKLGKDWVYIYNTHYMYLLYIICIWYIGERDRQTDRETDRDRITMFSDWFKVINKTKVLKRLHVRCTGVCSVSLNKCHCASVRIIYFEYFYHLLKSRIQSRIVSC